MISAILPPLWPFALYTLHLYSVYCRRSSPSLASCSVWPLPFFPVLSEIIPPLLALVLYSLSASSVLSVLSAILRVLLPLVLYGLCLPLCIVGDLPPSAGPCSVYPLPFLCIVGDPLSSVTSCFALPLRPLCLSSLYCRRSSPLYLLDFRSPRI